MEFRRVLFRSRCRCRCRFRCRCLYRIPNPQSPIPNPGSSPMDTVFIEALEVEALIGIYDWERRIRQPLLFDIEMQFDNRVPAASDDIADTLKDRKSTRLNSRH